MELLHQLVPQFGTWVANNVIDNEYETDGNEIEAVCCQEGFNNKSSRYKPCITWRSWYIISGYNAVQLNVHMINEIIDVLRILQNI